MKKKIRLVITCLIIAVLSITSPLSDAAVFAEEGNDSYSDSGAEDEKLKNSKGSDMYRSEDGRTLANPRILEDGGMTAGQKVTWDCIWFGSYPQNEVESSEPIYNTLQNASGWNDNHDITIDGNRYHRIEKEYRLVSDAYHYFKYEPMKWRVLKIDGNQATIMSDTVLAVQEYDIISSAFTSAERSAIADAPAVNADNELLQNFVSDEEEMDDSGEHVTLNLDLSSDLWTDAGTGGSQEDELFFCVEYNANGGNEAPDSQLKQAGTALSLSDKEPVREGYIFSGWSKEKGAKNVFYHAGEEYTEDDNVTLYAVWKEEETVSEEARDRNAESASDNVEEEYVEDDSTISYAAGTQERAAIKNLANPRIVKDDSMRAGQKVTWDCVWFGNYPQSEVTSSDSIYSTLQNASGWNSKNEITLNGNRYRRMKKGDATIAISNGGGGYYYNWSDSTTWHYFKYEPIKWRVLKIDGNQALLLSDVALDDQKYHTVYEDVTWETSTIRSWLNGYRASVNKQGIDYSGKNFIGSAFNSGEQSVIVTTSVVNADNINYGTAGGNDTADKVFLLSTSEVCGDSAKSYGFASDYNILDEARRCKSSTYAKAMGVYSSTSDDYKGNCWWWLRSPGYNSRYPAYVTCFGVARYSGYDGDDVVNDNNGVRAALNLNLSSNLWSYAGAVCSKEGEVFYQVSYDANGGDKVPASQIKYSGVPLCLSEQKPVRVGYTFLGWSEDRDTGSVSYHAGDMYAKNANSILYAVWKKNEDGATNTSNPTTPSTPENKKMQQKITTGANSYTKEYGSPAFSLGAKASGGGKLTYSSSNIDVISVSSTGAVTVKGCGTAIITIKAAETQSYRSVEKKITVKVVPKEPRITTGANSYTKEYGSSAFSLGARASGGGKLTYSSSNKKIAAVSSKGKVTVKAYGTAKITIKAAASGNYKSAVKKITVKVVPKKITLKSVKSSSKKKMTISWKKTRNITGYEIYVSPRKDFKKGTVKQTYKQDIVSRTIVGWRSKTTYYVKIRAYKKVGKTTYYGAWSKVKKVKVK